MAVRYQLGHAEFPPLRTLNRTNLPVAASPLVGREAEVANLLGAVTNGARVITATGAGGSGKTRLALQAGAELVHASEGGVFWVPLARLHDDRLVTSAIAQLVGAEGDRATHFSTQPALLVVDNFEHVLGAASEVADLVCGSPFSELTTVGKRSGRTVCTASRTP